MFADLAERWRGAAATLRKFGAASQADVAEQCAAELEAAVREHDLEELALEAGAHESGYSYSAIQKMVATGRIPNVGDKGRPRVRRCDLPKKGGAVQSGIAELVLRDRVA